MTSQPMKFNFDLDLGRQNEKTTVLTETALNRKLEAARKAGYESGFVEGEASATAQAARQLALSAEDLCGHVAAMAASLDDQRKSDLSEAIDLAVAVGRKLAATLVAREPQAEIAALVAQCMASLENVPHLVIRCALELADAVRDDAAGHMRNSGFAGRLVVLGDPEIAPGDARIEWADGGVARSAEELLARVDETVAAYLAAHGIAHTPRAPLPEREPEPEPEPGIETAPSAAEPDADAKSAAATAAETEIAAEAAAKTAVEGHALPDAEPVRPGNAPDPSPEPPEETTP